jgi:hypothetical protein
LTKSTPLHLRQIPVQENQVRHVFPASLQTRRAVFGFPHGIIETFQNTAHHYAHHGAVVHDQTGFHGKNISAGNGAVAKESE